MDREIGGQKVTVTEGGNFLLEITSGLFISAGKIYNFPYKSPGVGINKEIVMTAVAENRYVIVGLDGSRYIIHPNEIIEICDLYQSYKIVKDTVLYIVPIRGLRRLGG